MKSQTLSVVLSHAPLGQLELFDAYFGEILLSQLRTPVHRNASFESPPSSFPLSTLAALVHAHWDKYRRKAIDR